MLSDWLRPIIRLFVDAGIKTKRLTNQKILSKLVDSHLSAAKGKHKIIIYVGNFHKRLLKKEIRRIQEELKLYAYLAPGAAGDEHEFLVIHLDPKDLILFFRRIFHSKDFYIFNLQDLTKSSFLILLIYI